MDSGLDQTDVLPPTTMVGGKYRLGRLLGEGGMGSVYEAEHTGLGVRVAVKLLNEVFVNDPSATQRFRREAKAAAAIRHPNIVTVTDTGTDEEGVPFIVMELLQGESLSAVLRREKVLSQDVAVAVAASILSGLAAAHDKNVIHRDLKPGNILLARTEDGACQVKILDFGISKFFTGGAVQDVTATGAVIGTPRFMAPEQARGQGDLDGRVDIYAAGVLLYRMATGKLPFAARTHEEIITHIIEGRARPPREVRPELSTELERIILKAMAPERADRYQNAREFLADLQQLMPDVLSGTVQITSVTAGFTNAPTPLSLSGGSGAGFITGANSRLGLQQTRPATPHALHPQGARRMAWILALVILLGAGGLGAWIVLRDREPAGGAAAGAPDAALDGPVLRIGITRYLPETQLREEHRPLTEYLARRLQRPVRLQIVEDYVDLSAKLAQGKLELAALSSYAYVRAKRRMPTLELLATHVTNSGTTYQGLIVAKADSGITELQDLKGKVFCYVGPNSTSGYLFPRAVLRQQGLDPDTAFRASRFAGDHLSALKALQSGACDGAAVFAGIFYEAAKHGMPPTGFTILGKTERIPYDAYCVPPGLPAEQVHSLREALLALKKGSDTAASVLGERSRIIGFAAVDDSHYDSVRRIEKHLDDPRRRRDRRSPKTKDR